LPAYFKFSGFFNLPKPARTGYGEIERLVMENVVTQILLVLEGNEEVCLKLHDNK